jgi:hypothetical protein
MVRNPGGFIVFVFQAPHFLFDRTAIAHSLWGRIRLEPMKTEGTPEL